MKTINQLREDLTKKTMAAMNFDLSQFRQGSPEWNKARLGVITASQVHNIIKKGRTKGSVSEARLTYMLQLVSEVITGTAKDVSSKQMEWGKLHEDDARMEFQAAQGEFVDEIPFIYTDDMRCGVSLDGAYLGNQTIEIKCPYTTEVHVKTVLHNEVKPEYITQMQFGLWITKRESSHFVTYDPRIESDYKMYSIEYQRDEELMKRFDQEIPKFIFEIDCALKEFGVEFGSQWAH